MMLLLDLGNTALKWAVLEDGQWLDRGRIEVAELAQPGVFEQAWLCLEPPTRVLLSSVAPPPAVQQISAWCLGTWALSPELVQAGAKAGDVINAYREPGRLGVDRWLAMLAARARTLEPVCVVDCGTAVTVDVLNGQGLHLGGLIVPGLSMMARSLETCTQVRLDGEPDSEAPLLARDTVNAVRGGALYAAVAFIDRVVADVEAELGGAMVHLITGGDASTVLPLLRHPFEHAPDLVLEGLAVLARGPICEP